LKDLATEVASRWTKGSTEPALKHLGREALELETLKAATRQRVQEAVAEFGQDLWQNPNLQANCFLLAEMAAWLLAAASTLGRVPWLSRRSAIDETAGPGPRVELGLRAWARCGHEIRKRLRHFDEDLTHLRRGFYAPEVRAAAVLFDRPAQPAAPTPMGNRVTRPLSILVIVEPAAADVPEPHVAGRRLLESHLVLTRADGTALEAALRVRDEAAAEVTVQIAAAGPRGAVPVLREALSLGAAGVHILVTDQPAVPADAAAAALAGIVRGHGPFDLVLGGAGGV